MDKITEKNNNQYKISNEDRSDPTQSEAKDDPEPITTSRVVSNDENLLTLKKVHAILLNCVNLTKKQRLEFAESERYFMKLYLKNLRERLKRT